MFPPPRKLLQVCARQWLPWWMSVRYGQRQAVSEPWMEKFSSAVLPNSVSDVNSALEVTQVSLNSWATARWTHLGEPQDQDLYNQSHPCVLLFTVVSCLAKRWKNVGSTLNSCYLLAFIILESNCLHLRGVWPDGCRIYCRECQINLSKLLPVRGKIIRGTHLSASCQLNI